MQVGQIPKFVYSVPILSHCFSVGGGNAYCFSGAFHCGRTESLSRICSRAHTKSPTVLSKGIKEIRHLSGGGGKQALLPLEAC